MTISGRSGVNSLIFTAFCHRSGFTMCYVIFFFLTENEYSVPSQGPRKPVQETFVNAPRTH